MDAFETLLVTLARQGRLLTRLVDAYTRVFHRRARVRVKLVVLLAILECGPPGADRVDGPVSSSRARFLLGAFGHALLFAVTLGVAAVLLLPARVLLARRTGR